ncbi:secreted RxLR effector peptide protein, putative [Phytophthora infestans T30-4]|uniref:Secreted RxLR effector peptide protein, putative n=1 Tax=Phytophthora infestans (strain T30-4) TaxID=403677 RepID=D0NLB1_PHYIT|nr:secreted RxLR effector peptide protein, putative [Phytophthora infestans T30-4]EEY60429.1 secreted RxLR effector peptide protein, putative [Phytophthora infestans T30-4]|eukprot:XP_002900225.1 secreted RxLR effector peptide protein, putative [Phytophthora infestans T30-4]
MRLSSFFVVIAATFVATSAALTAPNQVDQRLLRTHHAPTPESEERGIRNIPLKRLNSLTRKIDVDVPRIAVRNDITYFNGLSNAARERYTEGLSKLLKRFRTAKASRITSS